MKSIRGLLLVPAIAFLAVASPIGFAHADAATVAVQSLTPGTSVTAGQAITFTAVGSGLAGTPTYWVYDDFTGTSMGAGAMNAATGAFTWMPTQHDVGTHNLTVEATDGSGVIASISEPITVVSKYNLSAQSLSPGNTVNYGQTVTFTTVPSGFSPTSYSVNDSFYNGSMTSGNINSSGVFSWAPNASDVGSHTITVTGVDSTGISATATVLLQVNNPNVATTATTTTPAPTITTTTTSSSSLSAAQIQIVTALLQSYGANATLVQQVSTLLASGVAAPAPASVTTSGTGYVFSNLLSLGSTGADVTQLQTRLSALGLYSGHVTGYFGALTQTAVKAFQAAHGLAQVGYVGPGTRAALNGQ